MRALQSCQYQGRKAQPLTLAVLPEPSLLPAVEKSLDSSTIGVWGGVL